MAHRFEYGRRFQAYKKGTYYLPNDDAEIDRLKGQHHLWRLTLDGPLYVAPIPPNVSSAFDMGTGSGVWAIEFAEEHPAASVLGIDLSPIQPENIPKNCSFHVGDLESEWRLDRKFEYIHSRTLTFGIRNWETIFRQSYAHLENGGWLELQEFCMEACCEHETNEASAIGKMMDEVSAATLKIGIDLRQAAKFGPMLEKHGFINCQLIQKRWPFGEWSTDEKEKQLGAWGKRDFKAGLRPAMSILAKFERLSQEEIEIKAELISKEMDDPKSHRFLPLYIWIAQKPSSEEEI